MKTEKILILSLLLVLFSSCFKDIEQENEVLYSEKGLYVLCEGTGSDNNATLSYFSFKDSVCVADYFKGGLGKNANDMIRVGARLYIAVTESACVWVVDMTDGEGIKRISLTDSQGNNRKPRRLTSFGDCVYVSCWDGTVVKISVLNNEVVDVCSTHGEYPEGIAVAGNKIYVANSGGMNYPNYDSTVAVIDLANFQWEKNIKVMSNPQTLKSYKDKVYVLSTGDYFVTPQLSVIRDGATEKVISRNIVDFDFSDNRMYFFYTGAFVNPSANKDFNLSFLDLDNLDALPVVLHQNTVEGMVMPYHINIEDGTIYVSDRKLSSTSGEIFALDKDGNLLYKFPVLYNPSKVLKKD